MDAPGQMYYFQMLLLLLLMGVCTVWLGRMLQWFLLRKKLPRQKMWKVLIISLGLSYLLALLAWFCWPDLKQPMRGIFFLPAVVAETLILTATIFIFKKQKNT
ncbi:hypothetical protein [Mucilaginibacter sp.]|uniref:hypothetical protein n=1 Tax=Mucilaginibacter sp. TaxID=1882438 RepID=UPI003B00910A